MVHGPIDLFDLFRLGAQPEGRLGAGQGSAREPEASPRGPVLSLAAAKDLEGGEYTGRQQAGFDQRAWQRVLGVPIRRHLDHGGWLVVRLPSARSSGWVGRGWGGGVGR